MKSYGYSFFFLYCHFLFPKNGSLRTKSTNCSTKKMVFRFFIFFYACANFHTQQVKHNLENQRYASKSPRCSKALTLSGPLFVNRNKSLEAKKMTFFKIFFTVAHLLIETKLFCFYQNFISSAVQRNHGGRQRRQRQRRQRTTWTIIIPRQDLKDQKIRKSFFYSYIS